MSGEALDNGACHQALPGQVQVKAVHDQHCHGVLEVTLAGARNASRGQQRAAQNQGRAQILEYTMPMVVVGQSVQPPSSHQAAHARGNAGRIAQIPILDRRIDLEHLSPCRQRGVLLILCGCIDT